MTKNQLTPKQQKGCAIGCLSFIVIIVLILAVAAGMDSKNKKEKEEATEKALDTSLPIEERVGNAVISALGKKNNMDDDREIKVINENDTIEISFRADENLTTKLQVSTLENNIADVLKAIQPIEDLQIVMVSARMTFVDQYGNESINDALTVVIDKSEIDKINFENFNPSNLKNIAKYILHPGFNQ